MVGLEEARGCTQEGGPCVGDRDCVWGQWGQWSSCFGAEFCGIGYRKRERAIETPPEGVGAPCQPLPTQEVQPSSACPGSCDSRSCIDAEWAEWGDWGGCSVTCGEGGVQLRKRALAVEANDCGSPAEGTSSQYGPCSGPSCAVSSPLKQDCMWGTWSAWEPAICPAFCNGQQKRTRTITRYASNGGEACMGGTAQVTRCNPAPGQADPPGCLSGAPVDCVLEEWSQWSPCSAQCGTGHRVRRRNITQEPKYSGQECANPLEENEQCEASAPCVDWSKDCQWADWEGWSHCNPITGQKSRSRTVLHQKVGSGKDCEGSGQESGDCGRACQEKTFTCEWAPWSSWTQCSLSCGPEGRRTRMRELQIGAEVSEDDALAVPAPDRPDMSRFVNANASSMIAKYSTVEERLVKVSEQRRHDMSVAFASGLGSFVLLFGIVKLATRRVSGHRGNGMLEARSSSREAMLGHREEPFLQE